MKNYIVAVVALAAACAGPAAEQKSTRPAESKPAPLDAYYPLAVGNEWTYEFVSGDQRKRDTIKIVKREGPWFFDDHRGRLRWDEEGLRDADRYLLRAPLKAKASWTAVDNLVVQRFEIAQSDAALVTPAGTFLGCVTVRNEELLPENRGRFVTEWTYAPEVGMVKVKTAVEKPDGTSVPQLVASLVEYRLVK